MNSNFDELESELKNENLLYSLQNFVQLNVNILEILATHASNRPNTYTHIHTHTHHHTHTHIHTYTYTNAKHQQTRHTSIHTHTHIHCTQWYGRHVSPANVICNNSPPSPRPSPRSPSSVPCFSVFLNFRPLLYRCPFNFVSVPINFFLVTLPITL